jgi:hypothetical protein
MIKFEYKEERLRTGEIIFRPVAKAYLLRSKNEWIAEYFYVDSGADFTIIPYQMGKFLKLDKSASEIKEIGGIGGNVAARFASIPMKIDDHEFDCTLAWIQIERVPFLLGRETIFDNFEITFQQRKRKTIFTWQEK